MSDEPKPQQPPLSDMDIFSWFVTTVLFALGLTSGLEGGFSTFGLTVVYFLGVLVVAMPVRLLWELWKRRRGRA